MTASCRDRAGGHQDRTKATIWCCCPPRALNRTSWDWKPPGKDTPAATAALDQPWSEPSPLRTVTTEPGATTPHRPNLKSAPAATSVRPGQRESTTDPVGVPSRFRTASVTYAVGSAPIMHGAGGGDEVAAAGAAGS